MGLYTFLFHCVEVLRFRVVEAASVCRVRAHVFGKRLMQFSRMFTALTKTLSTIDHAHPEYLL